MTEPSPDVMRRVKLEALRAAIQEGIDSGPAEKFDSKELIESVKHRGREKLKVRFVGKEARDPTS